MCVDCRKMRCGTDFDRYCWNTSLCWGIHHIHTEALSYLSPCNPQSCWKIGKVLQYHLSGPIFLNDVRFLLYLVRLKHSKLPSWINQPSISHTISLQLLSEPFVLVNLISFFTVLQIDLLFSCYYGQKLSTENARIADCLCDTDWYSKSSKIQKASQLLILRAQKRVGITAGKFYMLSYETYRQSLQSIVSYYLILRKVYVK